MDDLIPEGADTRVQTINDDTVLEITVTQPVKTRISESELLRKQEYLTEAIGRFQSELDDVNGQLTTLYAQANS